MRGPSRGSMNGWIGVRSRIIASLDRSDRSRRAVIETVARTARRRGADSDLVAAAIDGAADRPTDVTLQMIRWAGALRGVSPTPRHFKPAEHLDESLQQRLRDDPSLRELSDPHLVRQLWSLGDDDDFDRLVATVRDRLPELLTAATPVRREISSSVDQLQAIATITTALAPHGHRPFLMSGTLLGVVRDGAPIPSDYDVDLGLLPDDASPSSCAALLGDHAEVLEETPDWLALQVGRVKVDLFFHVERDGLLWHRTKIHEWWNQPFGLVDQNVDGTVCWLPDHPRRYLDENYGPDWGRPAVFYDMSFDTPNRHYRRTAAALTYLVRRTLTALEDGDRWSYEACLRALGESFGIDITATDTEESEA